MRYRVFVTKTQFEADKLRNTLNARGTSANRVYWFDDGAHGIRAGRLIFTFRFEDEATPAELARRKAVYAHTWQCRLAPGSHGPEFMDYGAALELARM